MNESMKNDKALWGSISILVGIVIAILALVRGDMQTWLLLGVFSLWGTWIVAILLLPYMRQAKRRQQRKYRLNRLYAEGSRGPAPKAQEKPEGAPMEHLLLRHVNHRISSYLHSAYPEVTWSWCEKEPERLAIHGGIGRIRVYGVPDFDHADVTVDQKANISCSMVKIVPLSQIGATADEESKAPPNRQPVDPQIWYEVQGREVMETLMADLNSRGHNSLTLYENGNICIRQDNEEVAQEQLPGFPDKTYWPRLVKVFERNGLAAEITGTGIVVTW